MLAAAAPRAWSRCSRTRGWRRTYRGRRPGGSRCRASHTDRSRGPPGTGSAGGPPTCAMRRTASSSCGSGPAAGRSDPQTQPPPARPRARRSRLSASPSKVQTHAVVPNPSANTSGSMTLATDRRSGQGLRPPAARPLVLGGSLSASSARVPHPAAAAGIPSGQCPPTGERCARCAASRRPAAVELRARAPAPAPGDHAEYDLSSRRNRPAVRARRGLPVPAASRADQPRLTGSPSGHPVSASHGSAHS